MNSGKHAGGEPLRIEGEMTIYSAAALGQSIVAAMTAAGGAARLDLSQVTEIDTAGLQILLMARKLARPRGGLTLIAPSPRVQALLRLCGLDDLLAACAGAESAS